MVDDPITMLRDALQGQTLTHITRLIVTTENAGGVSNIPFITAECEHPGGGVGLRHRTGPRPR